MNPTSKFLIVCVIIAAFFVWAEWDLIYALLTECSDPDLCPDEFYTR